jgi:hypothetical protein
VAGSDLERAEKKNPPPARSSPANLNLPPGFVISIDKNAVVPAASGARRC